MYPINPLYSSFASITQTDCRDLSHHLKCHYAKDRKGMFTKSILNEDIPRDTRPGGSFVKAKSGMNRKQEERVTNSRW